MTTSIRALKDDCTAMMENEIRRADFFMVSADDTNAYAEYRELLTEDELTSCFAVALRRNDMAEQAPGMKGSK